MASSFNVNGSKVNALLNQQNKQADNIAQSKLRLSTGQRINSTSDDPGGAALSATLQTDRKRLETGERNISDAVNLVKRADAAVDEIVNLVSRLEELANQASNTNLNSTQRATLSEEFQKIDDEIRRIASTTKYNNTKLLSGQKFSDPVNKTSQLTQEASGSTIYADISADGSFASYYQTDTQSIEIVDTETGEATTLFTLTTAPTEVKLSTSSNKIAFTTTDDLTGENSAGVYQLFVYDIASSSLTQVTSNPASSSITDFNISADGSTVAIATNVDYSGTPTATTDEEVYSVDLSTNTFTGHGVFQVANVVGLLELSPNGEYLSYVSNVNVTGENPDGDGEAFIVDIKNGTTDQITNTTGSVEPIRVFLTNEGNGIYSSSQNRDPNLTADGHAEIFYYNKSDGSTKQLTDGTYGVLLNNISIDGKVINFLSSDNYTGENSQGIIQAYTYDYETDSIDQITGYESLNLAGIAAVSSSNDGNTLLFTATQDPFGQNPEANTELFIIDQTGDDDNYAVSVGNGAAGLVNIQTEDINGKLKGLGGYLLTSQESSVEASQVASDNKAAIEAISKKLKSGLDRLQSAQTLAKDIGEDTENAVNRIRNADTAQDFANILVKEIKQRSAQAVLAQANLDPRNALSLLDEAVRTAPKVNDNGSISLNNNNLGELNAKFTKLYN